MVRLLWCAVSLSAALLVSGAHAKGAIPSALVSHANGDGLADTTVSFAWNYGSFTDPNVEWNLDLGTTPGGYDISYSGTTTKTSWTAFGLPGDGSKVYARLWSRAAGESCSLYYNCGYRDYLFYAYNAPKSDLLLLSNSVFINDGVVSTDVVYQGAPIFVTSVVMVDNRASEGVDTFLRSDLNIRLFGHIPGKPNEIERTIDNGVVADLLPVAIFDDLADNISPYNDYFVDYRFAAGETDKIDELVPYLTPPFNIKDIGYSEAENEHVHKIQLPQIRLLNERLNNHLMPRQTVPVDYLAQIGGEFLDYSYLVYTFQVETTSLAVGHWDFSVEVDAQGRIDEALETNNQASFSIEVQEVPLPLPWDDPDSDIEAEEKNLDAPLPYGFPTAADPGDPVPGSQCDLDRIQALDAYVVRPVYRRGGNCQLRSRENFGGYWRAMDVSNTQKSRLWMTEFWGPRGSGRLKVDDKWYYYYNDQGPTDEIEQGEYVRPEPSDIRNVFGFWSGWSGAGTPSIASGQHEKSLPFLCGVSNSHRVRQLRRTSFPGQIANHLKAFGDGRASSHFSPENTLMAMGFNNSFNGTRSRDQNDNKEMVKAWYRYFADRTNNFENVEVIWLGGTSRGAVQAIRIARYMKDQFFVGYRDIKIIVTAVDPIAYQYEMEFENPIPSGSPTEKSFVRNISGFFDGRIAEKHRYDDLFPENMGTIGNEDFYRDNFHLRLVGSGSAYETAVQATERYHYKDVPAGAKGTQFGFLSQDFINVMHGPICQTRKRETLDESIDFFLRKAYGITDYQYCSF